MVNHVRLFDLRIDGPIPVEKGTIFRTIQVFKCWVCGSFSNAAWMRLAIHGTCPNRFECWHHKLEDKLHLAGESHPASYLRELNAEIKRIRKMHESEIVNDIVGDANFSLENLVADSVRAKNPGAGECTHGASDHFGRR